MGNPADQTQASAAGDGPGDGDLVSPDRIRRLPVHLSGGDQAPAEPQGARAAWWLVGVDGGARPGGQLRAVPDGPEPAQPRHRATGGADGADYVADRQSVCVQGTVQRGAGDWPAGAANRLCPVFQSAAGRIADLADRLHRRRAAGVIGVHGLDVLRLGPEATAHGMEFAAGDDGDLSVLRVVADAVGAPAGSAATEPAARLAAAGVLHEHPDRLWRLCRSPGALGGIAGQCDAGDHAVGDIRCGGRGGVDVAGVCACRDDQWSGVWRGGAGGAGVGAGGVGAVADCGAQGSKGPNSGRMLCVGMPQWTLRVRFGRDAERPGLHSHAERGNDQSGQPLAPASSIFSGLTHASNSSSVRYPNCNAASRKVSPSA